MTRDEYNTNPTLCKCCSQPLTFERKRLTYCNSSCAASINNIGIKRHHTKSKPIINMCAHCKINPVKKGASKYCSLKCQQDFVRMENLNNWFGGMWKDRKTLPSYVRSYYMTKHNNQCELCGWGERNGSSGLVPLAVHHIDGDCFNHVESNLQVLCPNCHALTPTHGALNRGNSQRTNRRKQHG